ncbi:hypothetical protein [Butyrivibrio sp. AC2005]|uniref:hypothetical protein n=1 Tax=Butyrivibrio sp. AC2005 TaxID=1280672 RepID=UPI00042A553C|nr:hypothetical protein [Butyrivibrio sp. AC2005]
MKSSTGLISKPLSLQAAVGYKNMLWGLSFILMAVSYSIENEPFRVVIAAFAVIMSVLVLGTNFIKKEATDEMYTRHIGRAGDLTLNFILLLLITIGVFGSSVQKVLSVEQILYIVAGIGGILYGLLFNIFEKVDE